ncbi:MAG: hypothetical protein EOM73_12965 [Bacteroidia bacterium]|nr:hypothetical protein [Bacteroidia bacterium]
MERRDFIRTTAASTAGITLTGNLNTVVISAPVKKRPIHIFTKCLQFLDYHEMAAVLAELEFDGADLTVRPNGQVLPENVATGLPKAMKALQKAGVGCNSPYTSRIDFKENNQFLIIGIYF